MTGKNQFTEEQFIEAIKDTGGIITDIARKVGCNWYTAKKYIEEFPAVKRAYDDECESFLDLAEGVLRGNIKLAQRQQQGEEPKVADASDAKWLLARKGKARGYAERFEHDLSITDYSVEMDVDDEE